MIKKLYFFSSLWCIVFMSLTLSCYMHANVKQIEKEKLQKSNKIVSVSPTKAHLIDGSLIVFRNGCKVENDTLKGEGIKYDLTRKHRSSYTYQSTKVPIDSVICVKRYIRKTELYSTVIQNPIFTFFLVSLIFISLGGTLG